MESWGDAVTLTKCLCLAPGEHHDEKALMNHTQWHQSRDACSWSKTETRAAQNFIQKGQKYYVAIYCCIPFTTKDLCIIVSCVCSRPQMFKSSSFFNCFHRFFPNFFIFSMYVLKLMVPVMKKTMAMHLDV